MKKLVFGLHIFTVAFVYGSGESVTIPSPVCSVSRLMPACFRHSEAWEEIVENFSVFITENPQYKNAVTKLIYIIMDKPERFRTRHDTFIGPPKPLPLVRCSNPSKKKIQTGLTPLGELANFTKQYPEYILRIKQLAEFIKRKPEIFCELYSLFMFPDMLVNPRQQEDSKGVDFKIADPKQQENLKGIDFEMADPKQQEDLKEIDLEIVNSEIKKVLEGAVFKQGVCKFEFEKLTSISLSDVKAICTVCRDKAKSSNIEIYFYECCMEEVVLDALLEGLQGVYEKIKTLMLNNNGDAIIAEKM